MKSESVVHLLHRAGQGADEVFAREIQSLTPRQYAVLVCLDGQDGLSQTDIVGRTGIDRSTVADLVRRIARKGLVRRRRRTDDARAYNVQLTDAGRQALKAAEPKMRRVDASVLSALKPERREALMTALTAISRLVGDDSA